MSRSKLSVVAAFVLVGLVAALVLSGSATAKPVGLSAKLQGGAAEVPGPGDPNGSGRALVRTNVAKNRVCFAISWKGLGSVLFAHIHKGKKGVAGDVVVTLFTASGGADQGLSKNVRAIAGCVKGVGKGLLRQINAKPWGYYVNVHTQGYPAGAIRGQLKKS
jgi:hypothetical protein